MSDVVKYRGVVKAVPSGDTVVIVQQSSARSGPPPEKSIKLSSIEAPKLGWKDRAGTGKDRPDDPFAFEAREALRKKVIGQQVMFRVDPKGKSAGKRDYGEVYIGEAQEELSYWLVSHGWAKVREVRSEGARSEPHYARLSAAQDQAVSSGTGIHNTDKAAQAKAVHPTLRAKDDFEPMELYEQLKGNEVNAIVEQVRDGSTLRCLLPGFQSVIVFVAGIRSPNTNPRSDKEGGESVPEPFAMEAKYFTEMRLLNRDVRLRFEGAPDARGNFSAIVRFHLGAIDVALVREGLARIVDWNAAALPNYKALREAENHAKHNKLRIWKNYVPVESSVSAAEAEFTGRVVEVVSGDTVVVGTATGEKRVYLSSVFAPRMRVRQAPNKAEKAAAAAAATPTAAEGEEAEEGETPTAARRQRVKTVTEPWAFEAREYMRKKLIGKKVHVKVDYIKTGDAESAVPRIYGSIATDDDRADNVALGLVSSGLAKVQRHGQDQERARDYDDMMAAESRAKKQKRGVHGPDEEAPKYHLDGDADPGKAAIVLDNFRRERARAIVDFVINGARLKVFLVGENITMPFILAGIRTPKNDRRTGEVEQFGEQATAFTRTKLLQREVELVIDSHDKRGNLIGHVFLDKRNFAVMLLDEGLAWVVGGRQVESSDQFKALTRAEEAAKAAKKNWWSVYTEPVAEAGEEDEDAAPSRSKEPGREYYDVVVTEVVDCRKFYVQVVGEKSTAALENMMKRFAEAHARPESASGDDFAPKAGDSVSAQFTVDDTWYRAKIAAVTPTGFAVQYIDYGNSEELPLSRLRPLPEDFDQLAPQARECHLAFVVPPVDAEMLREANEYMRDLSYGKKLLISVEQKERGVDAVWQVSLYEQQGEGDDAVVRNIAGDLLESGLVRLQGRNQWRHETQVAELREREQTAKREHRNLWRYGEIDYDEPADQKELDAQKKAAQLAAKKAKAGGREAGKDKEAAKE